MATLTTKKKCRQTDVLVFSHAKRRTPPHTQRRSKYALSSASKSSIFGNAKRNDARGALFLIFALKKRSSEAMRGSKTLDERKSGSQRQTQLKWHNSSAKANKRGHKIECSDYEKQPNST